MDLSTVSTADLAYTAGIVDGEGTLGVWREKRAKNSSGFRYRVALEVSNTKEVLIDWLLLRFGGFKSVSNPGRVDQQPLWKWRCTTSVVAAVAERLLPYLVIKRGQAEMVLEFYNLQHRYDQRPGKRQDGAALKEYETLWQRGKTLNKRGV